MKRTTRMVAFVLMLLLLSVIVFIATRETSTGSRVSTNRSPSPNPSPSAAGGIRGVGVPGAVSDHYVVVFKPDSDPARSVIESAEAYAARVGGEVRLTYTKAIPGFAAKLTEHGAKELATDPNIAFVEQDRQVSLLGTQINPVWGLDRSDQRDPLLSRTYTYGPSANVTAYILDTGMRLTHTQYAGRASSGYDFIDRDRDASDCQGHGTHVAGTVGASAYGMAKEVRLVSVRVLNCSGNGLYSEIIGGVDWVAVYAAKPAVANMSLGGTAGDALDAAVRNSIDAGITYVVAAGNGNTDACTQSPARLPEAITVAAIGAGDARATFSNYGPCVDIFAPGVGVISTANGGDSATASMSGTSMAAPHVAGAAALYLAVYPSATPRQVGDALSRAATVDKVLTPGAGSPNKLLFTDAAAPIIPIPIVSPSVTPSPKPSPCRRWWPRCW